MSFDRDGAGRRNQACGEDELARFFQRHLRSVHPLILDDDHKSGEWIRRRRQEHRSDILAKLGARDLAEARKLLATLRERQQEVKGLGSQLEGVLEGRNLEEADLVIEEI